MRIIFNEKCVLNLAWYMDFLQMTCRLDCPKCYDKSNDKFNETYYAYESIIIVEDLSL